MSCKVSVIVPVYNVERYISQCIDSILNQTLRDIEIICINDGSTDNSGKLLSMYAGKDSRVVIINKENGGYGSACNAGLNRAGGKYISIIESDDFIDKNMLADLYMLAEENNAEVVKSAYYEYTDYNGTLKNAVSKINWSEQYNMPDNIFNIVDAPQFVYFHPSIWSCIYKKSFLDKNNIRFVEAKGGGWTDNPFQIQTLCLAKRIMYTDNAYYYYRLDNPTSSSNIVDIKNPFDRSDEVHEFLTMHKLNNTDFLAHLYKREISYIHTVLSGIPDELFNLACEKITALVSWMNPEIVHQNGFITNYERFAYNSCHDETGIRNLMQKIRQEDKEDIRVVNTN